MIHHYFLRKRSNIQKNMGSSGSTIFAVFAIYTVLGITRRASTSILLRFLNCMWGWEESTSQYSRGLKHRCGHACVLLQFCHSAGAQLGLHTWSKGLSIHGGHFYGRSPEEVGTPTSEGDQHGLSTFYKHATSLNPPTDFMAHKKLSMLYW